MSDNVESSAEDGESNAILMLNKSAEDADVDALYSILARYPDILKRIDEMAVAETPLHVAARAGNAHYALEIASLAPSMAWKLNHLGLSPLHLAVENSHFQVMKGLVMSDNQLVRVKGKGKLTPLHYLAKIDYVDALAIFLYSCPSAIKDVTVRLETAVHVALKEKNTTAFKVLLGWLERVNMEYILKYTDEDGNNALHIATSTNQTEVMKRLIKFVDVNSKNNSDLTAMDIFYLHRHSLDTQVGEILRRAKAKRASELTAASSFTLASRLTRRLSLMETRDKFLGISGQNYKESPDEIRNIILVVATLIAIATYQAVLSPPGGFWQDDSNQSTKNSTSNIVEGKSPHYAGQMIMNPYYHFIFFTFNTIAFYTSVSTILAVISGIPIYRPLFISTCLLMFSYFSSLFLTSPLQGEGKWRIEFFIVVSVISVLLIIGTVLTYYPPIFRWAGPQRRPKRPEGGTSRL